jgi:hypothetical protein
MSDERKFLTFDEAVAMLPDDDTIHTIINRAVAFVGADWRREDVIKLLRESKPELAGALATDMGHGIVIEDRRLFIETRKEGGAR